MYDSGRLALEEHKKQELTGQIGKKWKSVYMGIQVISNRLTPAHRDSKGQPHWYDLLVSLGHGGIPELSLEDLGLKLRYPTGTVVGLCGNLLKHEVKYWGHGERVCYAHFMRTAVLNTLGCSMGDWVRADDYAPVGLA